MTSGLQNSAMAAGQDAHQKTGVVVGSHVLGRVVLHRLTDPLPPQACNRRETRKRGAHAVRYLEPFSGHNTASAMTRAARLASHMRRTPRLRQLAGKG